MWSSKRAAFESSMPTKGNWLNPIHSTITVIHPLNYCRTAPKPYHHESSSTGGACLSARHVLVAAYAICQSVARRNLTKTTCLYLPLLHVGLVIRSLDHNQISIWLPQQAESSACWLAYLEYRRSLVGAA